MAFVDIKQHFTMDEHNQFDLKLNSRIFIMIA